MWLNTRLIKDSPLNIRTVELPAIEIEDFYLLEVDDIIVKKPSSLINGKVFTSDEQLEFSSYEEADTYGAMLVATGNGTIYTVLDYSRVYV